MASWSRIPSIATLALLACSSASSPAPAPSSDASAPRVAERVAVFRPQNYSLRVGAEREVAFHFPRARYGSPVTLPFAGDFDGSGVSLIGLYDPLTGNVSIAESNAESATLRGFATGRTGARPFAGRFDGNRNDTVGLYQPESGTFVVRAANVDGASERSFAFGAPGGWPFAGDFDGDGRDGIGLYWPETKRVELRQQADAGPADVSFVVGDPAVPSLALPVAGDFDGTGKDSLALFVPESSSVLRFGLDASGAHVSAATFGPGGYLAPIAGRFRAPTAADAEGFAWPRAKPEDKGFDAAALDGVFTASASIANLRSLLVIRGGALVKESYFGGADPRLGESVQSITKSVVSALVGIAVARGAIGSPDDLVSKYLPEYFTDPSQDPRKATLTIKHLLTMTTGLVMRDEVEWSAALSSPDPVKAVLDAKLEADPGAKFGYSTGVTHVLGKVVERVMKTNVEDLARTELFAPIGISTPGWFRDATGQRLGGSGLVLRSRDLARFGDLYLHGGTLSGAAVLPSVWTTASTTPQVEAWPGMGYGGLWWIRTHGGKRSFEARGNGGQILVVVPELELIVVTTAKPDVDGATSDKMFEALGQVIDAVVATAR